jgi:hypothetical protein
MKTISAPRIDAEILEVVVASDASSLTAASARAFLKLAFSADQQQEIAELLERNSEETITPRQLEKLRGYIRVGNFLNLLKAKARATLAHRSGKR